MTRTLCAAAIALMIIPIAADSTSVEKEIAIVHFDQLKDGKLEGNTKDITFKPITGGPGQTNYFGLRNELYTPREITLRILGLTEPKYDLYVNAEFVGIKEKAELEAGIPISFLGTNIPPAYRDYYTRLSKRCTEGVKQFESATDTDGSKSKAILKAIPNWVNSIETGDNLIRTTGVIVVPEGQPLSLPGGRYVLQPPSNFKESALHLAKAIHIIRGEAVRAIENEILRNYVLSAMTPLDFTLTSSGEFEQGKKTRVTAKLVNWTDREITGKVTLTAPDGWTVKEVSSNVRMYGYSKTAEATFDVTASDKDTSPPSVTAQADLMIENIPLKLQAQIAASE